MTAAADILRSARITTKSTVPGRYYATCPKCSPKRKPAHQKLECLGITIDEKGVAWGCNHCNWKGGGFYEPRPGKKNGSSYSPVIAQYIYAQADGTPYLKVVKTDNKKFPQFHWDGSAWIKGKPKGPKIPYRLPELLTAPVGPLMAATASPSHKDRSPLCCPTSPPPPAPRSSRATSAPTARSRRVTLGATSRTPSSATFRHRPSLNPPHRYRQTTSAS